MLAVARRSMRSHRVKWRCHCVAAVIFAFVLGAPRRSSFLGRRGVAVRTPPWCDRGFNDRAVFPVIEGEAFAVLAVSEHAFLLDIPSHCL